MLYLTKRHRDELVGHSKKEYPNEACGILAGKDGSIRKIYQMVNIDKSTKTFFMEPKQQFEAMKEIRRSGLDFIGVYHSHPESEAYPSAHDVELACYPEIWYVIISLKYKDNPLIRSFNIVEGKITEKEVKIE